MITVEVCLLYRWLRFIPSVDTVRHRRPGFPAHLGIVYLHTCGQLSRLKRWHVPGSRAGFVGIIVTGTARC